MFSVTFSSGSYLRRTTTLTIEAFQGAASGVDSLATRSCGAAVKGTAIGKAAATATGVVKSVPVLAAITAAGGTAGKGEGL